MMGLLLIVLYIVNVVYVLAEICRQDQEAYQYESDLKQGLQGQGEIQPSAESSFPAAPAFEEPGPDLSSMILGHIRRLLSQPD